MPSFSSLLFLNHCKCFFTCNIVNISWKETVCHARGTSLMGKSVRDFFGTKGFIQIFDEFFVKTEGFLPKLYETFGSEMPLGAMLVSVPYSFASSGKESRVALAKSLFFSRKIRFVLKILLVCFFQVANCPQFSSRNKKPKIFGQY